MDAMTAPTTVQGYVDPYMLGKYQYGSLYIDLLEHIPDLTFPLSIQVYARMRRDPKIAAILKSWTLNLRRAQWQVDPTGCRPEVVQAVADGLGLPIKGKDKPGAARLRGVSWSEHLAAALLMIPFGFSPFELQADTSDGTARLEGVWGRPPWTVSHLHVDGKTGALTGVTQNGATSGDSPQILAQNMAFYSRDREGSNWAGASLLRPCYASWLIKEEVRRAYGVANVRWSAGVPVMEALPGTNPTPAQMAEAAQMAQAARAGIAAGGSTPPGFTMKILGIAGSLPNSLDFLHYLDQQMSGSALLGFLDLGQTPNGSRALGDTFLDSFHLALEAEGEMVADVATRQIAARLVDWNYGETEPVPRVVVSGIGNRREVTAESLNLLLNAGALAADPALEAWVRREYKLPDRDPNSPFEVKAPKGQMITVPGTGGDQAPTGTPQPVETPTETVKAAAGRPVEPDYDQLAQQHQQAVEDMTQQWQDQASPLMDALVAATVAEISAGTLVGLGMLTVKPAVVAALAGGIATGMVDTASAAAKAAADDLTSAGVKVSAGLSKDSRDMIRDQATATASVIANGYASAAGREALRLAGPDADPETVGAAVRTLLEGMSSARSGLVAGNAAAAASTAQAEGRRAVFAQLPDNTHYQASERLDGNECVNCAKTNGEVFASLADALQVYPNGKNVACLGRDRCRGQLVPVLTQP